MRPNAPAAERSVPPHCVSWTGGFAETTFIQKPDAVPLFKSITDNILLKKNSNHSHTDPTPCDELTKGR